MPTKGSLQSVVALVVAVAVFFPAHLNGCAFSCVSDRRQTQNVSHLVAVLWYRWEGRGYHMCAACVRVTYALAAMGFVCTSVVFGCSMLALCCCHVRC